MGKYYKTDCHIPCINVEDHYDYGMFKSICERVNGCKDSKMDLMWEFGDRGAIPMMQSLELWMVMHFFEEGLFIGEQKWVIDVKATQEKLKIELPRTIVLE